MDAIVAARFLHTSSPTIRTRTRDLNVFRMSSVPTPAEHVDEDNVIRNSPGGGESLVRSNIRNMSIFKATQPIEVLSRRLGKKVSDIVKLDANENPYGPPPEVSNEFRLQNVLESCRILLACLLQVAVVLGTLQFANIYPDPDSGYLRAALAENLGVGSEYLVVGSGADELIRLIMSVMLDPGDKIVDCPPTFPRYEIEAALVGATVIKVPRMVDFSLNMPQVIEVTKKERPKCVFITCPNNPDGSMISDEDLSKLLNLPVMVVLDEAYIAFSGFKSRISWVKRYDNLIVLQTFSKSCGLAGLRVGYGAFPLSIVRYIWCAKLPYNVSVAAQAAALATLQNPIYVEDMRRSIVQERERMFGLLNEIPFLKPFPSYTNFILCEVSPGLEAKKLQEELEKMGVMIRHFNLSDLRGYLRITVGKPRDTNILLDCLRILHKGFPQN